jgi:SAM-dependent methyltransferase
MKLKDSLLAVYSLWQAPFARQKFAPILKETNLSAVRKVLYVGCGPGTNTAFFTVNEYLGLDIKPNYIESAKKKYQREFLVAGVKTYVDIPKTESDFVLINSFVHHIDAPGTTNAILSCLQSLDA